MAEERRREATVYAERGEVYSVIPEFTSSRVEKGKTMRGKVVYVPKNRRYAVLEFRGPIGTCRECFWPEDLKARCKRL